MNQSQSICLEPATVVDVTCGLPDLRDRAGCQDLLTQETPPTGDWRDQHEFIHAFQFACSTRRERCADPDPAQYNGRDATCRTEPMHRGNNAIDPGAEPVRLIVFAG